VSELLRLRDLMAVVEELEEVPLAPATRELVARLRPAIMAYADAEARRVEPREPPPSGCCPVCKWNWPLRKDGTIATHRISNGVVKDPRARVGLLCHGSGSTPVNQ